MSESTDTATANSMEEDASDVKDDSNDVVKLDDPAPLLIDETNETDTPVIPTVVEATNEAVETSPAADTKDDEAMETDTPCIPTVVEESQKVEETSPVVGTKEDTSLKAISIETTPTSVVSTTSSKNDDSPEGETPKKSKTPKGNDDERVDLVDSDSDLVIDVEDADQENTHLDTGLTPDTDNKSNGGTSSLKRTIKPKVIFSPDSPTHQKSFKVKIGGKKGGPKFSSPLLVDRSQEGQTVVTPKRRAVVDPEWLLPFDHGWKREIVLRNTFTETKARPADVYYYTPSGRKLRSGPQITKQLVDTKSPLTISSFTFVKEPIHEAPHEIVRYAGKAWGRPKSPAKSPKDPLMKKKMSPFMKSPLAIKKSAIATSMPVLQKAGGSPIKASTKLSFVRSPITGELKVVKPVVNSGSQEKVDSTKDVVIKVVKGISKDDTPEIKKFIISGGSTGVKPKISVAKKHTAKRPLPIDAGDTLVNIAKKYKSDHSTQGSRNGPQRLCDLECSGRPGVPPSLHCNVCMCMFHPSCVGRSQMQRLDGFVCKSCKDMNKKLGSSSSMMIGAVSGPPPLQLTPTGVPIQLTPVVPVLSGIPQVQICNSGMVVGQLPPLQAAPSLIRAPPPLRLGGAAPREVPPPLAVHHNSGIPFTNPPPPTLQSSIGSLGSIGSIMPSNPITVLSQSNLAPLLPSLVNTLPSQPISISMPTSVPKDISGQILALPMNVTTKLNMTQPVSLRVNGQRFVIPPNCFINTNEGAKVYLPQGYLPGNMTSDTTNPLRIQMSNNNNDDQIINVSPYGCDLPKSLKTVSPIVKPRRSRRTIKGVDPAQCFIQPLHVGYDCMLHIFHYLPLHSLLRASRVCRTWRRISEQHGLWRRVELRGCGIADWEKAASRLQNMHTTTLDLRGLQHGDDPQRTWHLLTAVFPKLVHLQHIHFGQCPGSLLHNAAEKLVLLQGLTAEFITDLTQEPQMWTTNVKLDIGKFGGLKELETLKLRGVCGLAMPSFMFSGGLNEMSSLTKLKTLSLTTLREVPEDEFGFLASLKNLQELELGDISHWRRETYNQLAELRSLSSLRLECGVDFMDGGLGEALLSLDKLTNLELIKFVASGGLIENLHKVSSLKSLSIWPDTEKLPGRVNTCTLRAVRQMTSLEQLDWGIMVDQTANSFDDCQDSNDSTDAQNRGKVALYTEDEDEDKATLQYLTVKELVAKLCDYLPDTKIRVFKVPIISTKS